jgi:two-component system phosphate regulon sensor histidine kinase PhoR
MANDAMSVPENPWLKVLRKLGDGVLLFDGHGHLQGANVRLREELGFPLPHLRTAWQRGLPPFDQPHQWNPLREALKHTLGTQRSGQVELILPGVGGGLTYYQVFTVMLEDASLSRGCVAVFRDTSAMRRTEKMRRDFVANVSHELRTPLCVLQGYSETLLEGALDQPSDARQFVLAMEQHTQRLIRLVEDLLDLSKLEDDAFKLELAPVWLSPIVDHTLSLVSRRAEEKNMSVAVQLAEGLPKVQAHPQSLEQILFNLLDNALKYSPAGSQVTLSVTASPTAANELVVSVTDQGQGIEAKHLPRLFERFYRVDKARSRQEGGTGLGLSIVKHLVQCHGGRIWAESTLGQGTSFCFTLKTEAAPVPSGTSLPADYDVVS